MCKIMEDFMEEIVKEEREDAVRDRMETVVRRMLDDGTLAIDKIANILGLSLDEVKRLQAERS